MPNSDRKLKRKVAFRWFHDKNIASFTDEGVPFFSIAQIARELDIAVVSDFELAADFLKLCPIVLTDVFYKHDGLCEVFLGLPVIYAWLFSRDKSALTEEGRTWVDHVWDQVQEIIASDVELRRLTFELLNKNPQASDADPIIELLGGEH